MGIEKDIREAVKKYSDMLYKICIVILCNEQDVQDAIQDTFCRYLEKKPEFRNEEHEKAWFIRTTINVCKDLLKAKWNRDIVRLEEWDSDDKVPDAGGDVFDELREAILSLPEKYRVPIHLYYYEEYSVREIARLLHRTESAIQTQLQRGREKIKQKMEGSEKNEVESRYLRRSNGEC